MTATLQYRLTLPTREEGSPPADGSPVIVLLHGRGSDMNDLRSLARVVPSGGALVTPQAPHRAADMGYGPGWAWYRYLGEDRVDPASLGESLDALATFLANLPRSLGFRPGPLVLGGFSQGGRPAWLSPSATPESHRLSSS